MSKPRNLGTLALLFRRSRPCRERRPETMKKCGAGFQPASHACCGQVGNLPHTFFEEFDDLFLRGSSGMISPPTCEPVLRHSGDEGAPLITTTAHLFAPESDQRVNLCGPPRRREAGCERHYQQQNRRRDKGHRIGRPHVEELASNDSCSRKRRGETETGADQ